MPIYEYQCGHCEHSLEALQKISDEPLTLCPSCSKPELKKQISAASFRLKGAGWYETDFKTGKKKQLADSDSNSQSASGSTPASKDSTTKKESAKPKAEAKSTKPKSKSD